MGGFLMLLEDLSDVVLAEQNRMRKRNHHTVSNKKSEMTTHMQVALQPEEVALGREEKQQSECFYMFSGHANISLAGHKIAMQSGNILYIAAHTPFEVESVAKANILIRVSLPNDLALLDSLKMMTAREESTKETIQQIEKQFRKVGFLFFNDTKLDDPSYVFERILCAYFDPTEFMQDAIRAKFTLLLIELLRGDFFVPATALVSRKKYTTEDFLKYIETHYQTINLQDMALFFNYLPHYFSNKLKKETGKSFMELVQERKMTVAKDLLQSTQLSTAEIMICSPYIGH